MGEFRWFYIGVYGPHTYLERGVLWLELAATGVYGMSG